jgi:2'-5' RNA ligase
MKRLFFALWPDEAVRRNCAGIAESIVRPGEVLVRPDNLHATLTFLGNVDAATEAAVIPAASPIPAPHSSLAFDALSFWSKPRILCLTAKQHEAELAALANKLTALARGFGIPVDERPFNPHVTLIRKAKASRQVKFEPVIWRSSGFCLVESYSDPEGSSYRIIKSWGHTD